ncbi:hypothetical protein ACOMHN_035640 [Nucella lapillus]
MKFDVLELADLSSTTSTLVWRPGRHSDYGSALQQGVLKAGTLLWLQAGGVGGWGGQVHSGRTYPFDLLQGME